MSRKTLKLLHEGRYAAEVEVSLIDGPDGWSPYLTPQDTAMLDRVRQLLRSGAVSEASRYGRVFELKPIPA